MSDAPIRIMDVLTEDQRRDLEGLGTPVRYESDQTIFWEGQPSHSVLIIQEGNVKVTRHRPDGSEMILAIRGPNEIMGDEGVLMDAPRSATVTTITNVTGLDLRAQDVLRFVDERRIWPIMYRAAVHRRRQSDEQALLSRLDVKIRLARWLLELAAEVGEKVDGTWVIAASMSQQDLASRIGASREAVAIELRKFRENGLITTGRRKILLHDLDALQHLSRG